MAFIHTPLPLLPTRPATAHLIPARASPRASHIDEKHSRAALITTLTRRLTRTQPLSPRVFEKWNKVPKERDEERSGRASARGEVEMRVFAKIVDATAGEGMCEKTEWEEEKTAAGNRTVMRLLSKVGVMDPTKKYW